MNLRTSLLILLVGGITVLGIISVVGNTMIKDTVSEIVDRENRKIEAALEMEINANEMSKDLLEIMERQPKETEYSNNIQDFRDFSKIYKNLIRSDEEVAASKEVDIIFDEYVNMGDRLIELSKFQLSAIIERRIILNDFIEVELDDILQPSQDVSDPQYIEKMLALEEMEINIHELISASRGYLLNNDQFLKERIMDSIDDFERAQSAFLSYDIVIQEEKVMVILSEKFDRVKILTEQIISSEDEKITLLHEFDAKSNELDDILDDTIQKIALVKIHEDEDKAILIINLLLIVMPIVFVVIGIGGYVFSKKFSNITKELVEVTSEFEKGNFDARVKISRNDEIGVLGTAMNVMADNLQKATKEKEDFVAMITHDLKQPLVPISGNAEMLTNPKMGELNEMQRECVDEILANASRQLTMIDNLVSAQKLGAGAMEYDTDELSSKAILADCIKTHTPIMGDKDIEYFDSSTEDFKIKGDKRRILESFTNIIQNAHDFVPNDGKIEIGALNGAHEITFFVKDNGEGIPKEKQDQLFKKYGQVKSDAKRKFGGTGLGLAVSQELVEGMKGRIWVESEKGEGTTFFFTIPKV